MKSHASTRRIVTTAGYPWPRPPGVNTTERDCDDQEPCNKKYPYGKEHFFDDVKFYTDIDVCERSGHDREASATFTWMRHQMLNPARLASRYLKCVLDKKKPHARTRRIKPVGWISMTSSTWSED